MQSKCIVLCRLSEINHIKLSFKYVIVDSLEQDLGMIYLSLILQELAESISTQMNLSMYNIHTEIHVPQFTAVLSLPSNSSVFFFVMCQFSVCLYFLASPRLVKIVVTVVQFDQNIYAWSEIRLMIGQE